MSEESIRKYGKGDVENLTRTQKNALYSWFSPHYFPLGSKPSFDEWFGKNAWEQTKWQKFKAWIKSFFYKDEEIPPFETWKDL